MDNGACRGAAVLNPDLDKYFFPRSERMAEKAIIKFCFACSVINDCDKWATENDAVGVWGGKWRKKGEDNE